MSAGLTERQAIEELRGRGYAEDFRLEVPGVRHVGTDRVLEPSTLEIVEVRRVEGESDSDAEAVVLGVRSPDGLAGILVSAFGPGLTAELGEHLRAMRRRP